MSYDSPYPDFSWSHSRDRALTECARAYYWRYYGSHQGWQSDAPLEARLTYALKQLTSFPMIVGTAVHECARSCAEAVHRGTARPSFEVMLAHVSNALNQAVIGSHHRTRFLRDPKRVVMLRDAWYSGRTDGSGLASAVAKARLCLRALEGSPVWEDVERCDPGRIVVSDSPEAFVHEGWPIYAGPDLVYRPGGGRVVILDWKTGDDSDAELQIPLYALYCRTVLGLRFREGDWFGRVVNLATGSDTTHEISRFDLVSAAERVRTSVGAMHSLLTDPDRNAPRPIAEFPLPDEERRRGCQFCPFYALCAEELERRAFTAADYLAA
jgi:hypothetical protein